LIHTEPILKTNGLLSDDSRLTIRKVRLNGVDVQIPHSTIRIRKAPEKLKDGGGRSFLKRKEVKIFKNIPGKEIRHRQCGYVNQFQVRFPRRLRAGKRIFSRIYHQEPRELRKISNIPQALKRWLTQPSVFRRNVTASEPKQK
jgi:hypothetical protein